MKSKPEAPRRPSERPMKKPRFSKDQVVRRNGELDQIQMVHHRSDGAFLYYLGGDKMGRKWVGGIWCDEDSLRSLTAREISKRQFKRVGAGKRGK